MGLLPLFVRSHPVGSSTVLGAQELNEGGAGSHKPKVTSSGLHSAESPAPHAGQWRAAVPVAAVPDVPRLSASTPRLLRWTDASTQVRRGAAVPTRRGNRACGDDHHTQGSGNPDATGCAQPRGIQAGNSPARRPGLAARFPGALLPFIFDPNVPLRRRSPAPPVLAPAAERRGEGPSRRGPAAGAEPEPLQALG